MTPREYEETIASHFRGQGYSVTLTPGSNDYGVDVFAQKAERKVAVQAKMYGGTARKVNREMVMQLHGAKDYFDCTEAVIVTNGDVSASAREVASKLRIQILPFESNWPATLASAPSSITTGPIKTQLTGVTFEEIWERHVMPLVGRALVASDGRINRLVNADWSGVKRISSSGREQFIPIEVFRQAVGRILDLGCVTRAEINDDFAKRASSGIVLILAQVPIFEHLTGPSRLVLREASGS